MNVMNVGHEKFGFIIIIIFKFVFVQFILQALKGICIY